jgi:hypothetical protein
MGYAMRYGKKPCCAGCASDVATGAMTRRGRLTAIGADDAEPSPLASALSSDFVKTASSVALVYHGYKRTGSLIWALLYGLAGRMLPTVAVPVALAQGFGTRKPCP